MVEDNSDTDISDVKELDLNDARSEANFARGFKVEEVKWDTKKENKIKALRNDVYGAWSSMALKTRILNQKFDNATNVADWTQLCTTGCTIDTLKEWSPSGGTDWQLVSETQKGQNVKEAGKWSTFAQWGNKLEEWMQTQLNESRLNGGVSVEPTDERRRGKAGIDGRGKTEQKSMATRLHDCTYDDQQRSLVGRTIAVFWWRLSRKWREWLHCDVLRQRGGANEKYQKRSHWRITDGTPTKLEGEKSIQSSEEEVFNVIEHEAMMKATLTAKLIKPFCWYPIFPYTVQIWYINSNRSSTIALGENFFKKFIVQRNMSSHFNYANEVLKWTRYFEEKSKLDLKWRISDLPEINWSSIF